MFTMPENVIRQRMTGTDLWIKDFRKHRRVVYTAKPKSLPKKRIILLIKTPGCRKPGLLESSNESMFKLLVDTRRFSGAAGFTRGSGKSDTCCVYITSNKF